MDFDKITSAHIPEYIPHLDLEYGGVVGSQTLAHLNVSHLGVHHTHARQLAVFLQCMQAHASQKWKEIHRTDQHTALWVCKKKERQETQSMRLLATKPKASSKLFLWNSKIFLNLIFLVLLGIMEKLNPPPARFLQLVHCLCVLTSTLLMCTDTNAMLDTHSLVNNHPSENPYPSLSAMSGAGYVSRPKKKPKFFKSYHTQVHARHTYLSNMHN